MIAEGKQLMHSPTRDSIGGYITAAMLRILFVAFSSKSMKISSGLGCNNKYILTAAEAKHDLMSCLEEKENMPMEKSQALIMICFIPPTKDKAIILITFS